MNRRSAALAAVLVLGAACGGGTRAAPTAPAPSVLSPSPPSVPSPSPSSPEPSPAPDLSRVRVGLRRIATLRDPLAMAVRPGDDALYFAQQSGLVTAVRGGRVDPTPVLDLTGLVRSSGEQGLLGLTFSPDGTHLYVDYTDVNGDTNVVEYAMRDGRADPSSARRLLLVHQPFPNHNGGEVEFGPDGNLWIGLGDGGSQGDPFGNGQNRGVLLAKILRIDPRPDRGRPYRIPPDNPFVHTPGARPEVWAYGLRNPWRFSFDRDTGDLWIADVGGSLREEIDVVRAPLRGGLDFGWNLMEGTVRHAESVPPGLVRPVFEYPTGHDGTCAVVGGYVYRGRAIPALRGAYLFGDFCAGRVEALVVSGRRVVQHRFLGIEVPALSSFGQDSRGELYVLSLQGPVYELIPR